eukprot:249189_1
MFKKGNTVRVDALKVEKQNKKKRIEKAQIANYKGRHPEITTRKKSILLKKFKLEKQRKMQNKSEFEKSAQYENPFKTSNKDILKNLNVEYIENNCYTEQVPIKIKKPKHIYDECDCNNYLCDLCQNKKIKNKEWQPVKIKRYDNKGWGIETVKCIGKNVLIIEYVGEIIDEDQKEMEWEINNQYLYQVNKNSFINAFYKGNESRMANHSNKPNTRFEKRKVEGITRVFLYSKQHIAHNCEITVDYGDSFDTEHFV